VRLVPRVIPVTGEVRVVFELGPPETAGPVAQIRIEGNTVIPTEDILEILELRKGDTFTSTLAEEDFLNIRGRYADEGYLILNRSDFNYLDGVYVQRIIELRISGYQVSFRGGKDNSKDFLVIRQMPAVGSVANELDILVGLRALAKEGAVRPLGREFLPVEEPEMVLVNLIVEETTTGLFTPSAQYATDSGFSAAVAFSEANFLGRAHSLSTDLSVQTSDIGVQLGARVGYSIPWIYLDQLGFRERRTSVAFSLFSQPSINTPLTTGGSLRVTHPDAAGGANEANLVRVGEYTSRDTGISFSVGRSVFQNTLLQVSIRGSISQNRLEPPSTMCTFDPEGNVENGGACSLPIDEAVEFLPLGGLSSFVRTRLAFDNRDNTDFPRTGIAATSQAGIGFGNDYRGDDGGRQSYVYQQVEFGVKTYAVLRGFGPGPRRDSNHVVAFRVNAGHQFGNDYPASRRFRVGRTNAEATLIRGYEATDFNYSRTYLTGSVEYRYDFDLDTFATQTVIGIVFVDLGYASSVAGYADESAPVFGSGGVGLQLNLGFGGVLFPALRFDYGFSQRNPRGVFSFRLGPVF
jgi:outer membrane protein insertion porin family